MEAITYLNYRAHFLLKSDLEQKENFRSTQKTPNKKNFSKIFLTLERDISQKTYDTSPVSPPQGYNFGFDPSSTPTGK
jgi:hypothetical protein